MPFQAVNTVNAITVIFNITFRDIILASETYATYDLKSILLVFKTDSSGPENHVIICMVTYIESKARSTLSKSQIL